MSTGSGWAADEMLMTNRTKYGYKSTYNADLSEYTIAIEREDSEEYRRREKEAEKIANEIESNLMYRHNVDIELSDGEGEEEAFSAVVRQTSEINNNNNTSLNKNSNTSSNSSGNSSMSKEFHGKTSRRSFNKQQQLQRNSMIGFYTNLTNLNSSSGGGHKNKSNRHQQQQANGQSSLGFSTRRVDLKIY